MLDQRLREISYGLWRVAEAMYGQYSATMRLLWRQFKGFCANNNAICATRMLFVYQACKAPCGHFAQRGDASEEGRDDSEGEHRAARNL